MRPHLILAPGIARTFQNIATLSQPHGPRERADRHACAAAKRRRALRVAAAATRREEAAAREKALEILSIFGNRLMPRLDQPVSSLSYANRRRVEIARALASKPKLLLLDEPTAGMNPAELLELADQIDSLNPLGLTILLIEHKLDIVVELANRVIVLDHGEKIAEGTPAEVRQNDEVIRALSRGAPRLLLQFRASIPITATCTS